MQRNARHIFLSGLTGSEKNGLQIEIRCVREDGDNTKSFSESHQGMRNHFKDKSIG